MPDPPAHGPGRAPSSSWELEQLAMRKLERERPDPIFQKRLLNRVGASLHFIEHPDPPDPDSVLTLAYDAIRHCVDVHLNINGLRVPNMAGAHRLYVEYAKEKMAEIIGEEDLRHYSAFRQLRNTSEYPAPGASVWTTAEVAQEAVKVAKRFFGAVSTVARGVGPS
jgi:hypothetical protein